MKPPWVQPGCPGKIEDGFRTVCGLASDSVPPVATGSAVVASVVSDATQRTQVGEGRPGQPHRGLPVGAGPIP